MPTTDSLLVDLSDSDEDLVEALERLTEDCPWRRAANRTSI